MTTDTELTSPTSPARLNRAAVLLLGFGLIVVAFNLRIAIAAVSPVLDDIQRDSHVSSAVGGLLTTVPVICFGAFAFAAPALTRRFGAELLLWLTMIVVTGGILLRLVPSLAALFAGTVLVGAAIAVANVLLPGLIKRDFPDHLGLLTGLYSMSLFGGAALSAGLTVPLEHLTGLSWRPVLAMWAVLALVAVAIWTPQLRTTGVRRSTTGAGQADPSAAVPVRGLWRDHVAWAVTAFMGLQSLGYYATLAWIPTLLKDHGMPSSEAGWMLSFSSFPGIAAAVLTPMITKRLTRKWIPVLAAVVLIAIGYLGLIAAPVALSYLWMTTLGLGQGASISLALGYIVLRSPDARHAAQLSTMAQGVGYLIACLGPFGLGVIHSATNAWTVPMLCLTVILLAQLTAGLQASRDRHVLQTRSG